MTTRNMKATRNYDEVSRIGTSCDNALRLNGYPAILSCADPFTAPAPFLVTDHTLVIVIDGVLQVRHGTTRYAVDKNQMILFRKDILIEPTETQRPGDSARYLMIRLKHDVLMEFVKLSQLTVSRPREASPVTIGAIDSRMSRFIHSLESYLSEAELFDEQITRIKLLELLFNLAQTESTFLQQLMDLRPTYRADITATVEENLMNAISLPQLAVLAGRSLSSFKRDFTAIYNMPPSTWLRQRRLQKARELLTNTTMNVTDVCYTLGFQNLAHFSRLFKSYFGYSPSTLRVSHLEVNGTVTNHSRHIA